MRRKQNENENIGYSHEGCGKLPKCGKGPESFRDQSTKHNKNKKKSNEHKLGLTRCLQC